MPPNIQFDEYPTLQTKKQALHLSGPPPELCVSDSKEGAQSVKRQKTFSLLIILPVSEKPQAYYAET